MQNYIKMKTGTRDTVGDRGQRLTVTNSQAMEHVGACRWVTKAIPRLPPVRKAAGVDRHFFFLGQQKDIHFL